MKANHAAAVVRPPFLSSMDGTPHFYELDSPRALTDARRDQGRSNMRFAVMLAAACALLMGGQAGAVTFIVTATGQVASGLDAAGAFGAANRDLSGLDYTVTATFVTGMEVTELYEGHNWSAVFGFGGSFLGLPQFGSAVINIDGTAQALEANRLTSIGQHAAYSLPPHLEVADQFAMTLQGGDKPVSPTVSQTLTIDVASLTNRFIGQGVYWEPFDYLVDPADKVQARFTNWALGPGFKLDARLGVSHISLAQVPDSGPLPLIPTTPTIGVPEPATWALMILGLGLTGAAVRRRHATGTTALEVAQALQP
jgi:hypothetical protein